VKRLHAASKLPSKAHESDAGYDLYSIQDVSIPAGETVTIRTGIAMEAPRGTYIHLAERSSLAKDYSLRVGGGVVDQGF